VKLVTHLSVPVIIGPTFFEMGESANITCSATSVFGWEIMEIRRINYTSPIMTGRCNTTHGFTSESQNNINVISTEATKDSFSVVVQLEPVQCHGEREEQYECRVMIGEDNITSVSSVVVQSKCLHP